ncbi:MAG TPA: hypothetical protein PLB62_12035 [Candidatus Sumerlaeota bacterium]|nr:hypothetical protein [Candidatus Sumerlaeota bacterium]
MVTNPNLSGAEDVIKRYNIDLKLIQNKINMYNKCRELDAK